MVNFLLEVDPKKRITVDGVLNHPWLKNVEKNKYKMNLFTAAEKVLLAKSNIDYRNANKDDLIEMFTLKNLDTLQETQNQNINTKSNILAPFNSSINSVDSFLHRDLEIENNVIKLAGKVKEINRQYELNNNGEIDNGIIISPQENSIGNTPNYSPFIPSPFNNSINNGNGNKKSKQVSPRVIKISSPSEDLLSKNQIKGGTYFNSNFIPFATSKIFFYFR